MDRLELTADQMRLKKKLERKLKTTLRDDEVVELQQKQTAWQLTRNYRSWILIFRVGGVMATIGLLLQNFGVEFASAIGLPGCVIAIVAAIKLFPNWRLFLSQIRREQQE